MDKFFEENSCGVLDETTDVRDFQYETLIRSKSINVEKRKLPKKFKLVRKLPPIRSQGAQGTCLAQVGACMKEYHERVDINYKGHMSPQYIFQNRANPEGKGMNYMDMLNVLMTKGCCYEDTYPYGQFAEITEEQHKEAANHKIAGYAKVETIDGLKEALIDNGVCFATFNVYNSGSKFWIQSNPKQEIRGRHAVSIVGYGRTGFIIRNSWGTRWGNKGYTLYPYKDWGKHCFIYTTIDDDSVKFFKSG